MKHKYSLVHLSDISCPPPQFIYAAAEAGYDCVSLRTIPMGLKGEVPHDIAADRQLFQDTKKALADTGIYINDTENARIYDGVEISAYEPAIAAIAEFGVKHLLTNIWTPDKAYYTEKFCELCDLAAKYDMTVNVEFVTWASVKDMKSVKELLLDSGKKNVGVVVDLLHFHRSRCQISEFDSMPAEWFNYVHLCDTYKEIPEDEESLIHTGRAERLYPGEGEIDIAGVLKKVPQASRGIEVPHLERVKELGLTEHARRALEYAKKNFDQI